MANLCISNQDPLTPTLSPPGAKAAMSPPGLTPLLRRARESEGDIEKNRDERSQSHPAARSSQALGSIDPGSRLHKSRTPTSQTNESKVSTLMVIVATSRLVPRHGSREARLS